MVGASLMRVWQLTLEDDGTILRAAQTKVKRGDAHKIQHIRLPCPTLFRWQTRRRATEARSIVKSYAAAAPGPRKVEVPRVPSR